jgi:hypothetical protein
MWVSIRKQLSNTQGNRKFVESSKIGNISLKFMFVFTLVLNIFCHGALDYMIRVIRSLQMIIHMPMLRIIIPANVIVFYEIIIPIIMFDILEADYSTKYILNFDEDSKSSYDFS